MKLKKTLWQIEEAGALLLAAIVAVGSMAVGLMITYFIGRAILRGLGVL